jgi:hypothetical protein
MLVLDKKAAILQGEIFPACTTSPFKSFSVFLLRFEINKSAHYKKKAA